MEATVQSYGIAAEKALRSAFAPAEKLRNWVAERRLSSDAIPAVIRLGSALALLVLCLGIAFQYALNRVLSRIHASTNRGLLIIDDADSITDGLDRLSLSQRSFLRTRDLQFSQDVAQSVVGIDRDIDSLRRIVVKPGRLREATLKLSGNIDWALKSLGRCNDVERSEGAAAALAYLDNDVSIDDARTQAQQVTRLAAEDLFDRVRAEHRMLIFDVLF